MSSPALLVSYLGGMEGRRREEGRGEGRREGREGRGTGRKG